MKANEVTSRHVTGSDPKVTSFDRSSPGRGFVEGLCQVLGTFELQQSCNLQEVAAS